MSDFHPLVSIVIPVYNGSVYMREAIDSALAQTYPNIEVIVVNDGSNDDGESEKIALSYGNRIRYFAKENGGVSSALNMGIANMRGEYFSWLSHDDVYYPHKIEKNIESIKDTPERIVYSDYDVIDGDGVILNTANFRKFFRYLDFEYGLSPVLNGGANGCAMLIHRSHFSRCGTFDENLRTTQDYDLFFKMLRGQRLVYINEPLTKYRSHGAQQTHINPRTVSEGNALWIAMLESLSDEEILQLGGSARMFWLEKANMLQATKLFTGAAKFAQEKYEACVSALKNAKISVIMPFFNKIDFMPKTIASVINQTYTNWELILANDGTSEDISDIEKIAKQDERIKLLNLPHGGVSAARNSAIASASGDFIALLDSDDLWAPQKLEKQLAYMLAHGFAFSHTSYEQRYLNGDLLNRYDVTDFCGDVFFRSIYYWIICTCTVMFERTTLGDAKFPEHISMGEDICLWFHFLWRYEAGAVSDILTTVRVQSVSASQNIYKRREALYSVIGYLLKNFNYEECFPAIGQLVYGFSTLFTPQPTDTSVTKQKKTLLDYPVRFLLALKKHGFMRFCKIFLQKGKRKVRKWLRRD